MILTGKAFQDFGEQCKYDYKEFVKLEEVLQYTLIIEWFDSVGWLDECIDIQRLLWLEYHEHGLITLKDRTEKALIKANEIYNEL